MSEAPLKACAYEVLSAAAVTHAVPCPFLDVITDQTENVFPMVPGGKGLSEMILV